MLSRVKGPLLPHIEGDEVVMKGFSSVQPSPALSCLLFSSSLTQMIRRWGMLSSMRENRALESKG